MQRSLIKILLFTIIFAFAFCDETSKDAESELETLEFTTEPTKDLSFMINEAPSDFTLELFSDNLIVNLIPGTDWSGEMVLSSLHIHEGEVVNRSTTPPVSVAVEELSGGLSTEELFPGLVYTPGGTRWVTKKAGSN